MPAILEVAIGTFFVFMLFSVVVTALNEVVMTFFDKRADFLRLGLGELLSDPQTSAVNGYLLKTFKFASSRWHWFLAMPAVRYFFKAEDLYVLPSVGIAAALLVCFWVIRDSAKQVAAGKPQDTLIAQFKAGVKEAFDRFKLGFIYDFLFNQAKTSGTAPTGKTEINVHRIFLHPLIFSHSKGDSDPSYIGSGAFAKAMLDLLVPIMDTADGGGTPKINTSPLTKSALEQAIPQVKEEKLRNSLAALLRSAQGDVDKFKAAMEDWFNDSMDRVTGWYKLHAQTWLMILGFILAVVCNVDALRIIQTLSTNPNLAKAVSAQAEAFSKTNTAPASKDDTDAARTAKGQKVKFDKENLEKVKKDVAPDALATAKAALDSSATADKPKAQKDYDQIKQDALVEALKAVQEAENWDGALADFKKDLDELSKTGIPMGWNEDMRREFGLLKDPPSSGGGVWEHFETNPNHWHWGVLFTALCGWTLTALAASLGAPFWFDLLQRVMNIKANGRAPDEKALGTQKDDDKGAPQAQAPVTGADASA